MIFGFDDVTEGVWKLAARPELLKDGGSIGFSALKLGWL